MSDPQPLRRDLLIYAALGMMLTDSAVADVVILLNGDRLTGQVVRQEDGQLHLETDYAGTLRIDWKKVRECRLDEPAALLLNDLEVLEADRIVRSTAGEQLQITEPDANVPTSLPDERVDVLKPEPWELGDGHRLDGAINIALQDESGNSESTELDLDFTLRYRRRWDEFESYGQLEYDTTRGIRTAENWTLLNKYIRRFHKTPWYGAGWLRLKHDHFADLRLRTIVGPALGYRFDTAEGTRLSAEIGPIYTSGVQGCSSTTSRI